VLESNTIFDTPDSLLRSARKVLRLRSAGGRHTIAFKNSPLPGRYKSREEIESELADPTAIDRILHRLGYTPVFRYEKYRTEYARPAASALVTLDETPIGDFLEIEGAPRSIDRIARDLGYSVSDYITASYGSLYVEHCGNRAIRPGHMLFNGRK
jgi:adenylate cyclase class 2